MNREPGWYQDPQRPPGHLRWWDGEDWTDQRFDPADAPVPAAWSPLGMTRRHPFSAIAVAALVALLVYGAAGSADDDPITSPGSVGELAAEPEPTAAAPTATLRAPAPERRTPQVATYSVRRVVDGDTLLLGNGNTVRLIGVDAPEKGMCGYRRAADTMKRMVLGKHVRLERADANRDKYDRLLRYVEIGPRDIGLRLIKSGVAVASDTSHPRETLYLAADRGTHPLACGG